MPNITDAPQIVPQLSVKLDGMTKAALRIQAAHLGLTMSELARRYFEDGLRNEAQNYSKMSVPTP